MYVSYAAWTAAACAGTPATSTSRAAWATAASADASGGVGDAGRERLEVTLDRGTASYIAPWTIPPSTLLDAGGRPTAIAPSATPLQ